jgi:glycosyltransferase involved in cell wall biosynthesis
MQQTPFQSDPIEASTMTPARAAPAERIIYIACPWGNAGGGMYRVADYLMQAQASKTPPHSAKLRALDTRGEGSAWASFGFLAKAIWKIARGRFDGTLAGVHVNMAEKLSLLRKGTVVVACWLLRVPVVIHLHATMKHYYEQKLPAPAQAAVRWMFSLASGVIVIGPHARRFVIDELGVPAKNVDIVINGVPDAAHPHVPAPPGIKRVAFVGTLCERKGVSWLLQALARAHVDRTKVQVTLAGNGELPRYTAQARELGIDDWVNFAGWHDQDQVEELLARSDVLVLPSRDEVLPLVILEALANHVAVLTTPVGETPTVLENGENARFVPVGDVDALAAALAELLDNDRMREELVRAGRLAYDQQFSLQRFFTSVARIHQRHFGISARLPEPEVAQELVD